MKVCEIPDCDRRSQSRGLCHMHYERWRRNGHPFLERLTWRETFWTHVEVTGFCWNWTACRYSNGYGVATREGRNGMAHRVSYELLIGPIPPGMQVDHLCRNRACVNPDHLEVVTQQENLARGFGTSATNARKTECIRGHEFTPENTYVYPNGQRKCRECTREQKTRYYARKKARKMVKAA